MTVAIDYYLRLKTVWQHSADGSNWRDVEDELVEVKIEPGVTGVALTIRNESGRSFHDLKLQGSAANDYKQWFDVGNGNEVQQRWDVSPLRVEESWEWSITGHFSGGGPLPPMRRPRRPGFPELPDPSFKITRKGS